MDLILAFQYIIVGMIVSAGLFIGKFLVMISPEEIRPGKKYLIQLQKILFILLLLVVGITIGSIIMRIIVILVLAYFLYTLKGNNIHDSNNYYLLYTAIGLFLGFISWNFLIYSAFLSFLIGIPTAALNYKKKLNVFVKLFIVFFIFYITSFLVYNLLVI